MQNAKGNYVSKVNYGVKFRNYRLKSIKIVYFYTDCYFVLYPHLKQKKTDCLEELRTTELSCQFYSVSSTQSVVWSGLVGLMGRQETDRAGWGYINQETDTNFSVGISVVGSHLSLSLSSYQQLNQKVSIEQCIHSEDFFLFNQCIVFYI